ncbi:lipid II flippase MurJ [Acinetobacter modestus]|uniref:lipid II flippase MurJ n=1 Tax=Acinetobacter modestus TaxID=1776740 RepID=UPI0030168C4E
MTNYKKLIGLSIIVLIINLLVSALGFIKEILVANYFGISHILDLYNLGIVIPLMFIGVISSVIVSVVTPRYIASNNKKFFVSKNFKDLLFLNLFISIALSFFLSFFFNFFFSDYSLEDRNLIKYITYSFIPIIFLQSFSSYMDALLNSEDKILKNTILGLFLPLGMIISLISFHEYGLFSLIFGFYIGYSIKVAIQFFIYKKIFFNLKKNSDIDDNQIYVRDDFINLFFSSLILAIMPVVINIYASKFGPGTVSSMNYAYKLVSIGSMLSVSIINSVYFPYIGKKFKENKNSALYESIRITFFAMFLISIILIPVYFYAYDIVSILFERGEFGENSVQKVSLILKEFVWYIPFYIGALFLSRTVLSLGRSRVFFFGNIISIVVLGFSLFLLNTLNKFDIGFAFFAVYSISFIYLLANCLRK